MPDPSRLRIPRRLSGRRVTASFALVALVALVALTSLTACSSQPDSPASGQGCARISLSRLCPDGSPDVSGSKVARGLLQARVSGWADGSRTEWLSGVEGSALQAEQAQMFDRMTVLGVQQLALRSVTAITPVAPVSSEGAATSTPTASTTPTTSTPSTLPRPGITSMLARFSYRLAGFDTDDRTFEVLVNVKLAADPTRPGRITAWSPQGRPQLWDLPNMVVRRNAVALVVTSGPPSRADDLLARAASAESQVRSVWGSARPAVWVAPATNTDAALQLGRDPADAGALRSVSAVTDGPLRPGLGAGADRIVVVPDVWRSLSGAGRQVVMTHELTHVVVRATTTGLVPLWLSEGLAELVAYRQVGLPEKVVVAPALRSARTTGLTSSRPGLPPDSDFRPGSPGYEAAYGWSLLAVRVIVDAHGVSALVRFYRAVAGTSASGGGSKGEASHPPQSVDDALASVLGTDQAALTRAVQARAKRLLS